MLEVMVVTIVFGSMLGALYLVLEYFKARRSGGTDRSLTQGELTEVIEDAVDRATADLKRRIENLEAIAVEEPVPTARLQLEEPEDDDFVEAPRRESQRARS